jgi:outer membrane protein OmpA-like peptidoglycan-associated protein
MISALAAAMLLAVALPCAAQQTDRAGSKDPKLLTRMPGFYIEEYSESQFDAHEFVIQKGNSTANQHVEGHLTYWRYDITTAAVATAPSWLQMARNYQNAVERLGGKKMYDAGPGNNYDSTFLISKNGADTWIELHPRGRSTGSGMYTLLIVEVQKMQQDVVANADALKSGLGDSGHVEVPGIFFDTAKSDIKPESGPAIDEIAKLLANNPALKVGIVGHTDMVGDATGNLRLSQARAQSVITDLVSKHGIAAARLVAFGAGPWAPLASNKTEDGRAKNRRVELVEIATK